MNNNVSEKYTLLGTQVKRQNKILKNVLSFVKSPSLHFLIFGVLIYIVANLATTQVLPYSWLSALATTFSYSIAAIGFCLLMGYSGLASLATGGFIGIGSYAVYYIVNLSGMYLFWAILAALAVAAVIGVIVGFISLRIEGIYLVILTLGLSEILRNVYMELENTIRLGANKLIIFGEVFKRQQAIYLILIALVVVMFITHNLINSPTGRAMLAMKNSTAASQAMGISLLKYRLLAFVICTMYASLTGVFLMITVRSSTASNGTGWYALITSLNILAAVIIGGYKSIWGAVFGTFVMYGMQTTILGRVEYLANNPEIITFVSGILVILVVMFYPGGLAQLLGELKNKIKKLIVKLKEVKYGKDIG